MIDWKVAGHAKNLRAMEQDIAAENLAHAYLFTGPPQVGKYTFARRLAKILQCGGAGCDDCNVCLSLEKGYHADTIEMAGEDLISIELIRDTLARLSTTTPGRYKIFLVKNIERMKLETANTLLKNLEEPASSVKFLFTSSAPDEILPTILSRVRTVKFTALSSAEILQMLQGKHPSADLKRLQSVADLAMGLPGKAVQMMEDSEMFTKTQALFERVRNVLQRGDVMEKFALVEDVTKDKKEDPKLFHDFCDIFLLALRYTMLDEAQRGGQAGHEGKLQRMVDVITQTQRLLSLQKNNVNARLTFENLMLQI